MRHEDAKVFVQYWRLYLVSGKVSVGLGWMWANASLDEEGTPVHPVVGLHTLDIKWRESRRRNEFEPFMQRMGEARVLRQTLDRCLKNLALSSDRQSPTIEGATPIKDHEHHWFM